MNGTQELVELTFRRFDCDVLVQALADAVTACPNNGNGCPQCGQYRALAQRLLRGIDVIEGAA